MGNIRPDWQQESPPPRPMASWACRLTVTCAVLLLVAIFFPAAPVRAQVFIATTPPLPNGEVGSAYNTTLIANGDDAPFTWNITGGALPPGLNLDSNTGTISGTPNLAGTFSFNVEVEDNLLATATQAFAIEISSPPLIFTTSSLPSAMEGTLYSAMLSVTGGTSPYTWSITSGTLPAGLQLDATTGYISGTPLMGTAGTNSFIIGVTDSSSPALSAEQSFSLTIEQGAYQPTVTIGSGLEAGETQVFVGGSAIGTLRGGESLNLTFDLGTSQSIEVEPIVEHPSKADVRFKAEADTITVSELSPNANFPYCTEYFIEFETDPADIAEFPGEGWYEEGETLRASAFPEVEVEGEPDTQYGFSHWWLPSGETVSSRDLSLTVSEPGSCIANYDTYYRLTLISEYGNPEGTAWYKAGSQAEWSLARQEVPMSGFLGVFGGKLKAPDSSGTVVMDGPRTVAVEWEPEYTMPLILIPLALLLVVFGSYGLYRLWRRGQAPPAPAVPTPQAIPPQPIPPPQTTVVMIGDRAQPKQPQPQTTRDQLMQQFGQLLQKYEEEISGSSGASQTEQPPRVETVAEARGLPAPQAGPPVEAGAGFVPGHAGPFCEFASRKLLRVVVGNWRQVETKTAPLPPPDDQTEESGVGLAVEWERDIYQEWEIFSCSLPPGHEEHHEGNLQIAYTLLNTITEEQAYGPGQNVTSPSPHYTDGMPQVEMTAEQIVDAEQLPPETFS